MSQATSAAEPEILTHDREQLAYLLTEAAEIEHGLMCCYLFAAFSLKRGEEDGLTAIEAAHVQAWRKSIVSVAIDEMLHLGLVNNLLTAIGVTPHFQRSNFPVTPGYHPAGVVVHLAPFCASTIDHFVFLERPEGSDEVDGEGFRTHREYVRGARADRLVPSAQDYATVGHLYRGIRAGLARLSDTLGGEDRLFVGDPAAQVGPEISGFPGLIAVTNLETAQRAIDTIVEQGEGAPSNPERSHYRRFTTIRDEFRALRSLRPEFDPAFPVATNPVMRKPPDPTGKVHVDAPDAARVVDVGNAVYAFALRCLSRTFGEADDVDAARSALFGASIDAMQCLGPLSSLLGRMPASTTTAGVTAGLTFTMQRSTVGFSQQRAAWKLLVERAREIAAGARRVEGALETEDGRVVLAETAAKFDGIASQLAAAAPST